MVSVVSLLVLLQHQANVLVNAVEPLALPQVAAQVGGTPHPIAGNGPESMGNVMDYAIAQPTPPPVDFNGVYCRGSACQYRVLPPPVTLPPVTPFPNVPYGLNKREFCRGLGCFPAMGWPGDPKLDEFKLGCDHLYEWIGGGMQGHPGHRTVDNVRQSFIKWCQIREDAQNKHKCGAFADVQVMALVPSVNEATVGDTATVCEALYKYIQDTRTAFVDLKLDKSALPKSASLLAVSRDLNHFGTGGVGPDSPRGRRWKARLNKHLGDPTLPANMGTVLLAESQGQGAPADPAPMPPRRSAAFLAKSVSSVGCKTTNSSDDKEFFPKELDSRGTPRYQQNAPCAEGVQNVPQTNTKYEIVPGSPDGTVGPVEVDGDLFTYCKSQMAEIMEGFAQTGEMTVQMTKDWCNWQASITDWVNSGDENGHPDWNYRNCNGMANFVGYALRNNLKDGMPAGKVCKLLFMAKGAVSRVDALIADAWTTSLRAGPSMELLTAGDAEANKAAMAKAAAYAASIFGKLRGQKKAFDDINSAKMDTAAFDKVQAPPKVAAPGLPDSKDFDMGSFVMIDSHLSKWGNKGS